MRISKYKCKYRFTGTLILQKESTGVVQYMYNEYQSQLKCTEHVHNMYKSHCSNSPHMYVQLVTKSSWCPEAEPSSS